MRTSVLAAAAAASLLFSSASWSACTPAKSRHCVDLDLAPEVSQQIVADEPLKLGRPSPPASEQQQPYTGPTVGIAPSVHRAPMVGYRWSIN